VRLTQFDSDRQAAAQAAQAETNRAALSKWLERHHPEIPDCTAVRNVFEEYMDFSYPLSDSDFEFALGNLETCISKQRARTPQEKKSEVIEEILSLLSAHSRRDKFMLKSEKSRMKHMSLDALQARLAELKYKIGAVSTPVSTLKAFVADTRADTRKYSGFPNLEKNIDASHIKNLSTSELKKLIRVYSVQQVNDRLSGRN
jgi:hypothetical protein